MRNAKKAVLAPIGLVLAAPFFIAGCVSNAPASRSGTETENPLAVRSGGNVRAVLKSLVAEFEQHSGTKVRYATGGAGKMLSAALQNRDADVYIAADLRHVRRAEKQGAVARKVPLIELRLAIVVRKGNPKRIAGLDDLTRAGIRVFIESPKGCQLGNATERLLRRNKLEITPADVSMGGCSPSPQNFVRFLESGRIDAAIVWESTARQLAARVDAVPIAAARNVRVNIVGVVFRFARRPGVAARFLAFLKTDASRTVWERHGFRTAGPGQMRTQRDEDSRRRQAAERMIRASENVLAPVYGPLAEHLTGELNLAGREGIGIGLGSGPGTLIVELCKRTRLHWVNADINPYFFGYFRALAEKRSVAPRVSAMYADAQNMPFRSNYADVIVSRGCYHFWSDRKAGFREIYRVLKPGGVAYIGRGFSPNLPVETARTIRAKQNKHWKYDPDEEGKKLRSVLLDLGIRDVRVRVPKPKGSEGINYGVWVEFRKPFGLEQ